MFCLFEYDTNIHESNYYTASQDIETEKPSQLTRKENADFRTSKKKNEKIWILKTVYGKHSIYFSDFLKKFKFSDRPFGEVL